MNTKMTIDEMKAKAIRATAEIQALFFEKYDGLTRHYNKALFIKKASKNPEFCEKQMKGMIIIITVMQELEIAPGVEFSDTEFLGGLYFETTLTIRQQIQLQALTSYIMQSGMEQAYRYLIEVQKVIETKQAAC